MSVKTNSIFSRYGNFVSIANAIILGYSGGHHLSSVERFSVTVGLYDILPSNLVMLGAAAVVALMLYSSVSFFVSGSLSSIVFSIATWGLLCFAVGSAFVRGIDVNCGCAMSDGKLGLSSLVKTMLLFLFSVSGFLALIVPPQFDKTQMLRGNSYESD